MGNAEHRSTLIETCIEQDGKLDILVSNAAVNPYFGPMLTTPEESWDKIFEINVKNCFQLIQESVPHLEQQEGSSIVCISSLAGVQPMPQLGAYSVSKAAICSMVRSLAFELGPSGIRINTVCPGVVKTKFAGALVDMEEHIANQVKKLKPFKNLNRILKFALNRFAVPDEISGIVSFLVDSNRASYVTGENYVIAGGATSRL